MTVSRTDLTIAVGRVNRLLAANGSSGDVRVVVVSENGSEVEWRVESKSLPIGWRVFFSDDECWAALHMAADLMFEIAHDKALVIYDKAPPAA